MAAAVGIGLTDTTEAIGLPVQPLAEGVIVYVAVPVLEVALLNTCAMELPLPDIAPVTLVTATFQLNVVPVTPFGLVILIELVGPEQMVWFAAAALGMGFTTTVAIMGLPVQPFAAGVIV